MGAVVALRPSRMPVPAAVSAWDRCPAHLRDVAIVRHALARRVTDRVARGQPMRGAVLHVLAELRSGEAEQALALLGEPPSPATLTRWAQALQRGGIEALAPKYNGRPRKDYGWEARAGLLYAQPQQPCFATVAYWLRQEGFATASESRVRRYLKSLPSNKSDTSPKRLGQHFYAQNIRPHVRRDTSVLQVGEVYEGDGHTCDVYVAHPADGKPFRPELTPWIDVRSQYIPGWWLGECESGTNTLYALSAAIRNHGHVPGIVHTDPGSGFDNKMLSDQALGFYSRLSITHVKALPGNARGKGLVEGWFRWFEERLGKRFETFCGHCRTDDALSRLRQRIDRGEMTLPSFQAFYEAVAAHIEVYNHTPKETLGGRTPAQVWADMNLNPLHVPVESLLRPHKECTVQRWEVRLFNRFYRCNELAAYERSKVAVEYDIHDERHVWVRDAKGRLICQADLVEKRGWAKENVLADRRAKRLEGQIAREQLAIDEKKGRARLPLMAPAAISLEALVETPAPAALSSGEQVLDRGHSLAPSPMPAERLVQTVAPVNVDTLARLRDQQLQASALQIETPAQRFALWLRLTTQPASIDAESAGWIASYEGTHEFHSRLRLHELSTQPENPQ